MAMPINDAIAKMTRWSHQAVFIKCREHGIKPRKSRREKLNIDKSLLQKLYVEEGKSADKIAAILLCNPTTIIRRLNEYKIPVRGNRVEGLTKRLLQKWCLREGRSTREIAKLLGCSKIPVLNRMQEYGIPLQSPSHARIKIEEETLRRLYVTERISIALIDQQVGCCYDTVFRRVKRYGLDKEKKGRMIDNGKQ
jgi:hypothetical protein